MWLLELIVFLFVMQSCSDRGTCIQINSESYCLKLGAAREVEKPKKEGPEA